MNKQFIGRIEIADKDIKQFSASFIINRIPI